MKKIGLGIAILLFAMMLERHILYFSWIIGVIGLILAIAGCVGNKGDAEE